MTKNDLNDDWRSNVKEDLKGDAIILDKNYITMDGS